MKKKIIVLAIAAAFSAPAFADNANITMYGKVYLNAESVKNDKITGIDKDSALRVLSNASRFGIKGSEDLGNGLNGIYQFEVQVDGDGSSTGKGFGSGTRNSGVGLEAGFGKVIVGVWDTPFKVAHNKIELFDNASSFTALNLIGRAGSAPASGAGSERNYNTRQTNLVEYWTPKFGAIQGAISYSPDLTPQATTGAGATGDQSRLSLAGSFEQDAISATAAYENRTDATTPGQTDSALRLVGKYTMGDIWVGATIESIKANTSATVNYTQKNLELAGQYKMGVNKFALSYAKAGSTNTSSTGANQLTLRYGHDYSARTEVFAAYTALNNDSAGSYSLTNIFGTAGTQQLGSKQTVIGAGVIHTF
jgi:predicted porin